MNKNFNLSSNKKKIIVLERELQQLWRQQSIFERTEKFRSFCLDDKITEISQEIQSVQTKINNFYLESNLEKNNTNMFSGVDVNIKKPNKNTESRSHTHNYTCKYATCN